MPTEVGPGDAVAGGCVNAGGRLVVRATRVGAGTQLAQMARLAAEAQAGKAAVQQLADRISAVFVPVVIVVAAATLTGWLAAGQPAGAAFTAAVAVLIIACPCAMGLATPTAILVGTGRGAQLGILISGPEVLESTRAVDTIVLDQTGTVTTGRMSLADVAAAPGEDPGELLLLAGAVEDASGHPVAAAIAAGARGRLRATLPAVQDFASTSGPEIRMPSWAPRPVPTRMAVGVARPIAHGQAMISTATAAVNAAPAGCPAARPPVSVAAATTMTTGTNTAEIRSASCCTAALPACASAASRAIWASWVPAPTRVARTTSRPPAFAHQLATASPGRYFRSALVPR